MFISFIFIKDTRKFAVDFQTQCLQTKTKLDPEDINIIDQLIQQVYQIIFILIIKLIHSI